MNKTKRLLSLLLSTIISVGSVACLFPSTKVKAGELHTYSDLIDNIIITAFHPISYPELLNREQFKLAADAGIDVMEYCGGMRVTDMASMKKALEFAAEQGILCNIYDDRIQNNALSMGTDALFKIFDEYKGMDGLGGYYLIDESTKPNDYAKLINAVIAYDPDSTPFINNFPDIWNDGYYADRLADLAHLIKDRSNFILSFDNYPFGGAADSVDEYALFKHFEAIRTAGNETNTRTGFYAQVIPYGYRKLNGSETLYHVNVGLAYGCTEINYFAWGTPNDVLCPGFGDAVIDRAGKPTDLYYDIIDINAYAHTIGTTLVKLRSEEVYHAGARSNNNAYTKLPSDFFVQTSDYVILSRMKDKTTGRNYLMVVNKEMNREQNISLNFTGVDSLYEVDQGSGEIVALSDYTNGKLTRKLSAGAAILLALPEGAQYGTPYQASADGNLLEGALVTASASSGTAGWFVNRINDGKCFSEDKYEGWQASSTDASEWLLFDLNEVRSFNRLDLYPARQGEMSGAYFPTGITVSVSSDGINYTEVFANGSIARPTSDVPVLKFDTVNGRYVKIELTKAAGGICELAEAKLFNDNGSVPTPPKTLYQTELLDPNVSVAHGKPIIDYSTNYEHPEWSNSINFATDGLYTTNWASDVLQTNTKDSVEYITIDLGNSYNLNRVVLHPIKDANGYVDVAIPNDIDIMLSQNGTDFVTVKNHKNGIEQPAPLELTFAPTMARYLKIRCTDLTQHPGALNCYMVQFSEVEAFAQVDELTTARGAVKKAIDTARSTNIDFFTQGTANILTNKLQSADEAVRSSYDDAAKLNTAANELNAAIAALVPIAMGENIALGKSVIASSVYYAPEEIFRTEYLTDGLNPDYLTVYDTHNGWSSDIYTGVQRDTPIDVTIDLGELKTVAAIFMQPTYYDAGTYPTSYMIMTSPDGNSWQTVVVDEEISGLKTGDVLKYKVDNVLAKYVKVHITKNSPITANGAYISQIGEIEVYESSSTPPAPTGDSLSMIYATVLTAICACCLLVRRRALEEN